MADNVTLSAGTADGAVIATDDITAVHYQILKLAYGALDSATLVTTSAGLPVQIQGTWNITNAGTFAVQVDGSALTALQLIDDIVHSGDAALSKYAVIGAVFDDTTPVGVTENQAQSLRMSSRRALLVEGVASGLAVSTNWNGTAPPIGAGVEATALRVTLATDSTGLVSVDDNAGSLTVDNAALSVTGGGVEATALRVTIASDSTGLISVDDNAGSLTIDGTVTASNTAGDVAHDGADSGNPVKMGAKAISSLEGQTLVVANDRSNLFCDLDGALLVRQGAAHADLMSERVSNTDGAATALTTFAAVASTYNYVRGYSIHNASATNGYVDFRDGTAGSVLWTVPIPANGGANLLGAEPLFRTSANTALAFDVSGALTTVYISVTGYQSKA